MKYEITTSHFFLLNYHRLLFHSAKYLLLIFSLVFTIAAKASAPQIICDSSAILKDSLLRKYLICDKKKNRQTIHFFKEGQALTVIDTLGRKFVGKLSIVDSETLVLVNRSGRRDTLRLGTIKVIKRVSTTAKIVGAVFALAGVGNTVAGIALLSEVHYGDPLGLYNFLGTMAIGAGFLEFLGSSVCFSGARYSQEKYEFKVIQTIGFELTRKHVKNL